MDLARFEVRQHGCRNFFTSCVTVIEALTAEFFMIE